MIAALPGNTVEQVVVHAQTERGKLSMKLQAADPLEQLRALAEQVPVPAEWWCGPMEEPGASPNATFAPAS